MSYKITNGLYHFRKIYLFHINVETEVFPKLLYVAQTKISPHHHHHQMLNVMANVLIQVIAERTAFNKF